MNNRRKNLIYGLFFILLIGAIIYISQTGLPKPEQIGYRDLAEIVKNGQAQEINVQDTSVTVKTKDGKTKTLNLGPNDKITEVLKDQNVSTDQISAANIVVKKTSDAGTWIFVLTSILPVLLIVGLFYLMMRQAQGASNQALSFGRSRARLFGPEKEKITFDDVAGVEEAKQELVEVVEFLKTPQKFKALGAKIPKGVLLIGHPGTGKTLLARAVAGEAGVPFYSISGSEFVEMFVGVGASRVRDLFARAKKNAPCIIFVDEIDAVGRQRGTGLGGSHDEREQTLNQILVEMDGFDTDDHVIVMAATNRPDVLDPALLRPGRFDRRVTLDVPDVEARLKILNVHAKNKPLETEVEFQKIAQQTPGFTGADLANLVNEAAILAARRNKKKVGMSELYESVEKVLLGPERRSHLLSAHEKKITAYHEAGHALIGHILPRTDPVHKVSIVSRGQAGGYTWSLPKEEKRLYSEGDFVEMIAQMLGGRVAEEVVFEDVTTGAENDLQNATGLARKMVMEYGMAEDDTLRNQVFGHKEEMVFLGKDMMDQKNFSNEVAAKIDKEVNRIMANSYKKAQEVISANRSKLDLIAEELVKTETIEGVEFDKLMKGIGVSKKPRQKK